MLNRLRFPAVLFFTASALGLRPIYFALSANGWWQSASALAYGLLLGFAVQRCFREPVPRRRIAAGAFLGTFMLLVATAPGRGLVAAIASTVVMLLGLLIAVVWWRENPARRPASAIHRN